MANNKIGRPRDGPAYLIVIVKRLHGIRQRFESDLFLQAESL